MLKLLTMLAVLFFVQPVFAQEEKDPNLPDYSKWELSEWEFQAVLYRGNLSHILGALYQKDTDDRTVLVYSEPISEDRYSALKSLSPQERFKITNLILGKAPLFVGYFTDGESADIINIYEPSRRWFEVYRLWWPRLRFVKRVSDSSLSQFIEQRYEVKFVNNEN